MKKFLLVTLLIFSLLATSVFADIVITTSPLSLSGNPGTPISSQFQMSSTETAAHTVAFSGYALTHTSSSSRTLSIDPITSVSLPAGATNQAVNFAITNTNVYAGTYQGTLVATSTTNSALTSSLQVQATISGVPGATVSSSTVSAGKGMTQTTSNAFTISNSGNIDLSSISISVSDLTDGNNNILSHQSISFGQVSSINYGSSAPVSITTTVLSTQPSGQYTGTISVNYGGSSSATAQLIVNVRDPVHEVKITNNEVKLGSSTQERGQTAQTSFTVQNSGDYTESVSLSLINVASDYSASLSTTSSITLTPGQSQSVTVTATVPTDQNSGVNTIGTIRLDYNSNANSYTLPLKLEAVSKLIIEDLDIDVAGENDDNVNDGDSIGERPKPEEEVTFDFKIKNDFASSSDIEIQDITVEIVIESIDDGDDIELEAETFDLEDSKSKDNIDLTFKVPLKVDADEYQVKIYVEGEDDNDAVHKIEWTLTLSVDKDKHDIKITEATLGTETLQCMRSTDLRVTLANIGEKDEDHVALAIYNQELGLNVNVADLELVSDIDDSDNEYTKRITIDVPSNAAAKSYPIEIRAYYADDIESDKQIIYLKVEDCQAQTPTEPTTGQDDTTTVVYTQPGTTTGTTTTSTTTDLIETIETPFTESTAFLLILVAANLLIVLGIIALVIKFLI